MDEYLTITELSDRIKYSKQSIYNLIHKRILVQQTHYFKPTPKKLLFKWSAVQDWIEGKSFDANTMDTAKQSTPAQKFPLSSNTKSRINI